MSIIQLKEADCRNCYKCIRSCPVKSITFHDDQARILEEECVLCGKCTLICPQNAKQIASDLDSVRAMLERRERVVVSLAPSFIAAFPGCTFEQVSGALTRLGFAAVEETAIGATRVSEAYAEILQNHTQDNLITTCCPTVVRLVQKYFPELLPQLAHVASPAVAHARLLREAYGKDVKVCFIGPCISKKQEAKDSGEIDAVLMFGELHDWLRREGIDVERQSGKDARPMHRTISRLYPVPGGIIKTIPPEQRTGYTAIAIDGLDRCIRVLQDIRDSRISGYLLELSSCVDSCVGGPAMHEYDRAPSFLLSKEAVYGFSRRTETGAEPESEPLHVPMRVEYPSLHSEESMPTEEEIAAILRSIGKVSPSDMLNCGGCGYDTCREKAIAVYRGKANVRMCLPYMRQRAESTANSILDNTPNALISLDHDLRILDFNPSAVRLFNLNHDCIGMEASLFLNMDKLSTILETGENVMNERCRTAIYDLMVEQSIIPMPNHEYLVIVKDISVEEESLQAMEKMRRETLETAQAVIDKQMRVAQEIASLLGETTGETKAALLHLKASLNGGERL